MSQDSKLTAAKRSGVATVDIPRNCQSRFMEDFSFCRVFCLKKKSTMTESTTTKSRSVYVLRDADALGVDFGDFSDGYVERMSFPGVCGIFPKDRLQSKRRKSESSSLLSEFLSSESNSVTFRVHEQALVNDRATGENSANWKRAAALCERQKFIEAAAIYSLSNNMDPLATANQSTCLQLGGELEHAITLARKMVSTWPKWEMGHVRLFSCLMQRRDEHGAVRALACGLDNLPNSLCMLRRLATLLREEKNGVVCLLAAEEGFALSLSRHTFELNVENSTTFQLLRSFHILVPALSRAVSVNGLELSALLDMPEYAPMVYLVRWQCGTLVDSAAPTTNGIASSSKPEPRAHLTIEYNTSACDITTTSKGTVLVFGSGIVECNRIYHPQGLRNERTWYENSMGYTLSFEQSLSGECGWVLGRDKQEICFVLHPRENPQGCGNHWISAIPNVEIPLYVGVNNEDDVEPTSALLEWFAQNGNRSGNEEAARERVVALKGRAMQMFEGGWYQEATSMFDLALQRSISAIFTQECEFWRSEAETETQLFLQAAQDMDKEDEVEQPGTSPTRVNKSSLIQRVVFHLTEIATGRLFEFKIDNDLLVMMAKPDKRQLWFCCCQVPQQPVKTISFQPDDVDLQFDDSLKIIRRANGYKQVFSAPTASVVKLLKTWKQLGHQQ